MKIPSKTEIIGIRFQEKGHSYDFAELLEGLRGIYLYHRPIMLLKTDTWTEGVGDTRGKFVYHYYMCRRRNLAVVIFNMAKTVIYNTIRKLTAPSKAETTEINPS
jgi:hypothetical protein